MAKATIQILSATQYTLDRGGRQMTLTLVDDVWEMNTHSAVTRAWGYRLGSHKCYRTLQDVEKAYKTWAGIHELASEQLALSELARIAALPAVGV